MPENTDVERCLPTIGLMPEAEERASFENVHVVPPAGIAYGYTAVLPARWHMQPDPPGARPIPSADHFSALGVFTPAARARPPVVVSFGTTPAPGGMSVASCFEAYCALQGYAILAMRPAVFLAGRVIDGLASTDTAMAGRLLIRLALFEERGRLFGLAGMAPEAAYPRFVRALSLAMTTFELDWAGRATLPLV